VHAASMGLDVCICTHQPRVATLARVVNALAGQTVGVDAFRVLLVDNASSPPVTEEVLEPLRRAGFAARRVAEPTPGLARARLRVLNESHADWLLFVDDDNELAPDYVAQGLLFLRERPQLGAFGGKLLLPPELFLPSWKRPFLTYLGVRNEGDQVIEGASTEWGPWEPPGAGLFVRRSVLEAYAQRIREDPRGLLLGRRGRRILASCDDSLLVRQAPRLGYTTAYQPSLSLVHHLEPRRLRLGYLLRLVAAFGSSLTMLEVLIRGFHEVPPAYRGPRFCLTLWHSFRIGRRKSYPFAIAMLLHTLEARRTWAELAAAARTQHARG